MYHLSYYSNLFGQTTTKFIINTHNVMKLTHTQKREDLDNKRGRDNRHVVWTMTRLISIYIR